MDGWMTGCMHVCIFSEHARAHTHVYLYLLLFQFPCQIGLYHRFGQMENSSIFPKPTCSHNKSASMFGYQRIKATLISLSPLIN